MEELRARLPELPEARARRFVTTYALTAYEAHLLAESPAAPPSTSAPSPPAAPPRPSPTGCSATSPASRTPTTARSRTSPFSPEALVALLDLVEAARSPPPPPSPSWRRCARPRPDAIVRELGLARSGDDSELEAIVRRAIEANPKPAADYRAGKTAAIQALIGRVMGETKGRYPPDRVRELLQRALDSPHELSEQRPPACYPAVDATLQPPGPSLLKWLYPGMHISAGWPLLLGVAVMGLGIAHSSARSLRHLHLPGVFYYLTLQFFPAGCAASSSSPRPSR